MGMFTGKYNEREYQAELNKLRREKGKEWVESKLAELYVKDLQMDGDSRWSIVNYLNKLACAEAREAKLRELKEKAETL